MKKITRRSALVVFAAGALWVSTGLAGHASDFAKTTHLEFNRPVALPGVTLTSGEYTFELADPNTSRFIVRVRDRRHPENVRLTTMTNRVYRKHARNMPATVTFGEARPGMMVPIAAWFPEGDADGYAFIY